MSSSFPDTPRIRQTHIIAFPTRLRSQLHRLIAHRAAPTPDYKSKVLQHALISMQTCVDSRICPRISRSTSRHAHVCEYHVTTSGIQKHIVWTHMQICKRNTQARARIIFYGRKRKDRQISRSTYGLHARLHGMGWDSMGWDGAEWDGPELEWKVWGNMPANRQRQTGRHDEQHTA